MRDLSVKIILAIVGTGGIEIVNLQKVDLIVKISCQLIITSIAIFSILKYRRK